MVIIIMIIIIIIIIMSDNTNYTVNYTYEESLPDADLHDKDHEYTVA